MPIYEYECPACEKVLEVQQRMSDDPLSTCPDCGGKVKKLVSMSSFHLKGGGWYSDGYSSKADNGSGKSSPAAGKQTGGADKKAAPAPGKKSDSKVCKKCPASS